jgi:hypothetical protein
MATTYTLISSVTVGSGGAAEIDFTSIPATYTDLVLKTSSRLNVSDPFQGLDIKFNNATTNFTFRLLEAYGSNTLSSSGSTTRMLVTTANTATASTFGSLEVYIPNYAGSNNKSLSAESVAENNSSTWNYFRMTAGLWSNSSAINRITVWDSGGSSFMQYSTAYLYGISNA